MKRVLISLAAIFCITISASAQQKGEQSLGISLDYNTGKTKAKSETTIYNNIVRNEVTDEWGDNFSLNLEYGYFVADNLRVGANLGFGITDDESETRTFHIAPNVAYYVRLADKFYYTPNLSLGFGCGSSEYSDGYSDEDYSMCGFVTEFQPFAVEFRPTKRFAMSVSLCSLQYTYLSGKIEDLNTKIDTSALSFNLLGSAQVGFKLYF